MTSTSVEEKLAEAIRARDLRLLSKVVDHLRFENGLDYMKLFELAHERTGISIEDWDALLYEVDQALAQDPGPTSAKRAEMTPEDLRAARLHLRVKMGPLADKYFGACPECGSNDGYLNIGRAHFVLCDEHKLCWQVGENLFSSWRSETEDVWQENHRLLSIYREIPMPVEEQDRERASMGAELEQPTESAASTERKTFEVSVTSTWRFSDVLEVEALSEAEAREIARETHKLEWSAAEEIDCAIEAIRLESTTEHEKGTPSLEATSPSSTGERVLRVGDKVIWKPGGLAPPSVEEVSDIRSDVNLVTGAEESLREISWERLREEGPAIAVFLKDKMPSHGWLLDPADPLPVADVMPYEPGEAVLFQGDSPFLPSGTAGLVESVSQSGVEVVFENGYRFTLSPKLLVPAPEYDPTPETNL